MVNIKLSEDQQLQYDDNIVYLDMVKKVINANYSNNKTTFVINMLNQLNDELYLLKLDLEEFIEDEAEEEEVC